jgi:hypothetical protein
MRIANKYGVDKLTSLCAEFLENDIKIENACQMFEAGPRLVGDASFGLNFIEENTKAVIESRGFTELSEARIVILLEDDNLRVKESDLFQALMRWGKAELKRVKAKDKDSKIDLQTVLARSVKLIRFPLFSVNTSRTMFKAQVYCNKANCWNCTRTSPVKNPRVNTFPKYHSVLKSAVLLASTSFGSDAVTTGRSKTMVCS